MMRNPKKRGGFFLVIVLIVIAVATMAVYSFTQWMVSQDDAAYLTADRVQTRVAADSAIDAMRVILSQPPSSRADRGGLYNNPQLFQAVNVSGLAPGIGAAGERQSSYSMIAPTLGPAGNFSGIRFGLQDESARLNLNALPVLEKNSSAIQPTLALAGDDSDADVDSENIALSLLLALPDMTVEIAESILDWIDENDEARDFGAESEYYQTLPTPYQCPNGPLRSVDELLLVRGVTPNLLYGADSNRNGVLDADEQQRFGVSVDSPGALGWANYLTVHGAESNRTIEGAPRVNVNQDDLESLYDQLQGTSLGEIYTTFIVAYRIAGQSNTELRGAEQTANNGSGGDSNEPEGESDGGEESRDPQTRNGGIWTADLFDKLDLSGEGSNSLTQILDLVDAQVTIDNGGETVTYQSPFVGDPVSMAVYMADLMDSVTTQDSEVMPGRINLNTCPAELLYGIPLISEEAVQLILDSRDPLSDDPVRRYETWLLVEGILSVEEMRSLTPLVCGGGDVFRAQIIGYNETNGISTRVEAILDATTVNPKLVSWRNLSHLGRGFDLSVLGSRSAITPQ